MFNMLYAQIGAVIVIAVCMFAFLKGDDSERIGAGTYLLLWFATVLVQSNVDGERPFGMLVLDIGYLAILCGLSWRSRRSWPVWAAGLQLLAVFSHILMMVDVRLPIASLYTVLNLTGYGVLACIAVGTFWAWQERRAANLE
jgi:hypothetical protein